MSLAGTVGAMSLGCSLGDIMAISELAVKVYTAYKDAPGDYSNISDEVKSLDIIINNAAQHFKSTTLSDSKRLKGQEVLRGCQKVLEDLNSLIVKYNSLASASTSRVFTRIKLGTEDIATLRARLTSNTTLLNGFIQSCEFDKIQARLDSVLGLQRTMSNDSIISFAGSINTKKAYKRFCKGLFNIGVTAEMISQKEKEIQDIFRSQNTALHPQLPEVGTSSDAKTSPISSNAESSPIPSLSTDSEPKYWSTSGRFRPPIDFLVGSLIISAAAAGNTHRLVSILEYVRNIDYVGIAGHTALHQAAHEGHRDIVQLLLSQGASVEAMTKYGSTPLHFAAWNGQTSTVELLLQKGASTEAMDKYNYTPLLRAAAKGHTSTVELLVSKGASTDAMDKSGFTPLRYAALGGHNSTVELLLSKGASVESKGGSSGDTLLHIAARQGHTSTVELLLSKGASIEALDNMHCTPLHSAAFLDRRSMVKLLLSKGASTEAITTGGQTPLDLAILHNSRNAAKILKKKSCGT